MKNQHIAELRKAGFKGKATIERIFEFINKKGTIHPWFDLKQNKQVWRCSITDNAYNSFEGQSDSMVEAVAECCFKYHKDGVKTGMYTIG